MTERITVDWSRLQHECDTPPLKRHEWTATMHWRCEVCGQKWDYTRAWGWDRKGTPSRRWRKAEARRLAEAILKRNEDTP